MRNGVEKPIILENNLLGRPSQSQPNELRHRDVQRRRLNGFLDYWE